MNAVWVITSQYCGLFSTLDECGWMSLEFTHWWPSDSYRGHKKYFFICILLCKTYTLHAFVSQLSSVHKQLRSRKIWGDTALSSACQSMTAFHSAVHRDTGILSFSLMLSALCWSSMHVLSVCTDPFLSSFVDPSQVNDNLNPSWVNFPSSCSSLVLVTRTADVYVCGFTVGTTFSPEMIQTAQNLPAGTSS